MTKATACRWPSCFYTNDHTTHPRRILRQEILRIRQKDDDPSLFAPDEGPPIQPWRAWVAFAAMIPLIFLGMLSATGLVSAVITFWIWATSDWESVQTFWRTPRPRGLSFLAFCLISAGATAGVCLGAWFHYLFVSSEFVNYDAYNKFFQERSLKRMVQVWLVLIAEVLVFLVHSSSFGCELPNNYRRPPR